MKSNKELIGITLTFISIFLFILIFFYLNGAVGLDGHFTLYKVALKPFPDMMAKIFQDVHPPLYYFIIYSVFNLLQLLNISFDPMIVGKIVSWIPIGLLLIFNLTILRKRFGWLFAGIFSLCIVSLPNFMFYGNEIRMYTWGLLFLTIAFYYAYKTTVETNWKNWGLLVAFTILGCYTQYFIAEVLFCMYFLLLIYLLINNRKEVKKWTISAIIAVIGFLPWLPVMFNQISEGHASWITPPDLGYLYYTLFFVFSETHRLSIIGILLILSFIVLIIYYYTYYLKNKAKEVGTDSDCSIIKRIKKSNFLVWGLLIFLLTIIIGSIISHLIVPSFLARYLVPALGIMYLAFTYLLTRSYSKKAIFVPILIIVLLSSAISTSIFIDNQKDNIITDKQYKEFIKSVDNNDTIIITTIMQRYKIIHRYGPKNLKHDTFLYPTKKIEAGLPKSGVLNDKQLINQIEKGMENGKTIYLFSKKDHSVEVQKLLNKHGYKLVKIKTIHETNDEHTKYPRLIYKIVKSNKADPS